MTSSSRFLEIPPEIRNVIYEHAFRLSCPLRLRTPSHRRLRPSRIDKDDPRSLLEVCRLIRREALCIFYSQNPVVFRSAVDALEFINDRLLHPSIMSSITHVAVDEGDVYDGSATARDQFRVMIGCLEMVPTLKTLEFRFCARTDDLHCRLNFSSLFNCWSSLLTPVEDAMGQVKTGLPASSLWHIATFGNNLLNKAMDVLRNQGFTITVSQSTKQYGFAKETTTTDLTCCNLIFDKTRRGQSALGPAEAAVQDRMARVGARPKRLMEMYDTHRYDR